MKEFSWRIETKCVKSDRLTYLQLSPASSVVFGFAQELCCNFAEGKLFLSILLYSEFDVLFIFYFFGFLSLRRAFSHPILKWPSPKFWVQRPRLRILSLHMKKCTVCVGNPFNRIFNRGWFLHPFMSSSCAVQTSETPEEDETHELNYVQVKSRMERYASSGCISKAIENLDIMRNFPGRPAVQDYNRLIYCYCRSGNVVSEELVELYNAMKSFGPYPNASTFNTLLYGMVSFGDLRHGILIAEEMCKSGFRPFSRPMSKLLKKSLELGSLIDSLCVLELMLRFDYLPIPSTANLLMVSLCRGGMIREAHFLFYVLLEKSNNYFQGGYAYCHNKILWALCKSGQIYNALAFFCYLKKKGIVYNVYSYTALVYGFCREKIWGEAFYCLSVMGTDGCYPNVITYTVILKFLCDDGKIQEALGLLEKMEKEGCDPDLVSLNIVLRELCHQNMPVEMNELVELIDRKGFSPDPFTYAAFAGGLLKRGKVETAKRYLLDMSRDCVIDAAVCNIYLHALCCDHKLEEALSLVNSMMEVGIKPNNISYNTILKGICEEKNIDEALEFFDRIRWGTNMPDLVSFNTILSAACKEGNTSVVRRLLYRMEYEGFQLNVVSSTCLIHYFCKVGKIPECLKLLESMMTNGPNPNIVTFNTLINNLCKIRLPDAAHQIFSYLKSSGLSPNNTTYKILIRAYTKEQNHLMVSELLTDMYRENLKPDAVTCESFIKRLCKEGKISVALQIWDQMRENGIIPNIGIYNTIFEALLERGKFWDIVSLFKEMAKDQCEANEVSFEIFNRAISKGWLKDFPRATKQLKAVLGSKSKLKITS